MPVKKFAIGDRTFEPNDILRLECTPDEIYDQWLDDAPTANITISNTDCDGLTGSVYWWAGNGNQAQISLMLVSAPNNLDFMVLWVSQPFFIRF